MQFGLSKNEIFRYSRQLVLPELGLAGQQKLKQASALLVGVGGLGSVQALYLAAAGVGRLGLVDGDVVDVSNLQRQILYNEKESGQPKVRVACDKLLALNPEIKIETWNEFLTRENAAEIVQDFDFIIDSSDNFSTRYLVNDVAVFQKKPVFFGSVYRFEGQVTVFDSRHGPCYRCLYPVPPDPESVTNCITGGILGVVPGMVGLIQATEVIKYITGLGQGLAGKLMLIDSLNWDIQTINIEKNKQCPLCGDQPSITELIDYENFCGEAEINLPAEMQLSPGELNALLATDEKIRLLDVRETPETIICRIEKAWRVSETELVTYVGTLSKDEPVILYCRTGVRSARAAKLLNKLGYTNVRHLTGGIIAWIEQIDPSLPRY